MEDLPPHVAILPTPGMGHLIPLVELAKRLISQHALSITFIVPTDGPLPKAQKSFLESVPAGINYVLLPPANFDDLPNDVKIETRICLSITRSLPSLRDAIITLLATTRLVAFVVDLFGTDAFDVAKEFNVPSYIFYPANAMCLSLFLHLPKLDEAVSCEYGEMTEPVRIPGCIPIHGNDLLDPVQDRKNDAYKWVLHQAKRYAMAEGIMVNTFRELEEGALRALQEDGACKPPVYSVGPLIRMDSSNEANGSECLKWLDGQPSGSVLYISFGSGGTLSYDQLHELALGLETSEQRFLWVVRPPNDTVANPTYFTVQGDDENFDFLPQGFLDRNKGHGLVVHSWAPQAQILGHGSTGGFLTHCGWNSILESVAHGIPLIAWPLYAEQRMNAAMVTDDLKVALRPKLNENGLVGRAEIAKVVKGLMEGEEGKRIRNRMKDLKDAASRALAKDGSSQKSLAELACKWKNNKITASTSV